MAEIVGTDDIDILDGTAAADEILGLAGNDIIRGAAGNDILRGQDGDDALVGGAGADVVLGGAGADTIVVRSFADAQGDRVDGGSGQDELELSLATFQADLELDAGADGSGTVAGLRYRNVEHLILHSGTGDDHLAGGSISEDLWGEAGDDRLEGRGGSDYLAGGDGNDVLLGGAGDDVLLDANWNGTATDRDVLRGGSGNDRIESLGGSDRIDGDAGDDEVSISGLSRAGDADGGMGEDVLIIDLHRQDFIVDRETHGATLDNGTHITGFESYHLFATRGHLTTDDGNDEISCESGSVVDSGGGDDTVSLSSGSRATQVALGAGDDKLSASAMNLVADGGSGHNTFELQASGQPTAIDARIGSDDATLTVGSITLNLSHFGRYELQLGDRSDTLTVATDFDGAVTAHGGNGSDDLRGGAGDDQLVGGRSLDGASDIDRLDGGGGNDRLFASRGTDTVLGGAGNDFVQLELSDRDATPPTMAAVQGGGDGVDQLTVYSSASAALDAVFRLDGPSTLGTRQFDWRSFEQVHFEAGAGDDQLSGGTLDDVLRGGPGRDALSGGDGNDTLDGSAPGFDTPQWFGNDRTDDGVADVLSGGAGNDVIAVGAGDHASGGQGIDRAVIDGQSLSGALHIVLSDAHIALDGTTWIEDIEAFEVIGTSGDDEVATGRYRDLLRDGAGDDVMHAGAGNDLFVRGSGDPAVAEVDLLDGGAGRDSLRFAEIENPNDDPDDPSSDPEWIYGANVVIDLEHQQNNAGLAEGLTLDSIEIIRGTDRADIIRGSDADERFLGGARDDVLAGRGGHDDLRGGFGNDRLDGGAGDDVLRGDASSGLGDRLNGGAGNDVLVASGGPATLTGGVGRDQFRFEPLGDFAASFDSEGHYIGTADEFTTITDFEHGRDHLVFSRDGYGLDSHATVSLVVGDAPVADQAHPQWLYSTRTHELRFDIDGSSGHGAILVAVLTGDVTLTASDLMLV